ncbi:MAG: cell surface protein [Candidatus Krumholzibacteriota bacterium]|nr:cell surface protein [Candidatus Krumholzibacteriota bacterium]
MPNFRSIFLVILCSGLVSAGCGAAADRNAGAAEPSGETPQAVYRDVGGLPLGDPLGLAVDFSGNMYIADGVPGRLVCWLAGGKGSLEFQKPSQQPGFFPCDVEVSAFFVYALDPSERTLLRFDNRGAYRDVLIDFDEVDAGRKIVPSGLDVDSYGRVAVSDAGSHQVILFNSYLEVELSFGSYGSHAGQFDEPQGVAFMPDGGFLVTDTGNKRVQLFDAGGKFIAVVPSGESTPLVKPRRSVADKNGNLYVADPAAGRVFVFGSDGVLVRAVVPAGSTRFRPTDIDVDPAGAIYVTDAATASLLVFR